MWAPLLEHLAAVRPATAAVLADALVAALLDPPPPAAADDDDPERSRREAASYRWTLGTWLAWLWAGAGGCAALAVPEDERPGILRQLARELLYDDDV